MDAGKMRPPEIQEHGPTLLLVDAKTAATMCGKSLRTWRSWDAAGWIPRPVRIGRSTLWRADELRDWVAAGCPRRADWDRGNDHYVGPSMAGCQDFLTLRAKHGAGPVGPAH